MRIAFVSDIHANMQAWNAVLIDLRTLDVDRIVCLGDSVGYGPRPAEVLQSVHQHVHHFVLGNHDAAVCGKMDTTLFNDSARRLIEWTGRQLNPRAQRFLASIPLVLDAPGFRCAHADLADPASFQYVIEGPDALPSWHATDKALLFVGHTHRPAIFVTGSSGTPHRLPPRDFAVESTKRYLLNPGSVGFPRGEARASYLIYDTAAQSVYWRHVPFDLDAYRNDMLDAGIDPESVRFLSRDPRLQARPLRELLSFSPAATDSQRARDVVEVAQLDTLRKRVRRWRTLSVAGIAASAMILSIGVAYMAALRPKPLQLEPDHFASLQADAMPADTNLLTPFTSPLRPGEPIRGWRLELDDTRRQSMDIVRSNDHALVVFQSNDPNLQTALAAPPIDVRPDMKFCAEALLHEGTDFRGSIAIVIAATVQDETGKARRRERFVVKEPTLDRRGGRRLAKKTFTLPAGTRRIQFSLRGSFTGRVEVHDVRLVRVDT